MSEDDWECRIKLPDDWFALGPGVDEDALRQQVEGHDLEPDVAVVLLDKLKVFKEDVEERDAIYGALMWKPHDVDGVYSANLLVFAAPRSHRGLPLEAEVEGLASSLREQRAGDVVEPTVETVEIPAGLAVRARVLTETSPDVDDATIVLDSTQYWVPLKEHDRNLIFSFSTPNLTSGDDLADLFDGIARTIEIDEAISAPTS